MILKLNTLPSLVHMEDFMNESDLLEIITRLQTTRQEWKTVDAKQELILREDGDKAEFVKDIIAMANNGAPSYIVIGLQDRTFSSIGRLSNHQQKNDINQILSDKVDPPIVIDYAEYTIDGNEYGVIEIYGHNRPYIVARDLVHKKPDRKQVRIYKGTIYVRHEDRTEGISRSELEEILSAGGLRREFEYETDRARQLAMERPRFWEYLLTAELLRSKLSRVRDSYNDLKKGLIHTKTRQMTGKEFLDWSRSQTVDLSSLIGIIKKIITEEIPASWGPPGIPGDPIEIKWVVEKLISACEKLLEWESDQMSVVPPESLHRLKELRAGWTTQIFEEILTLPEKTEAPFKSPNPEGKYTIEIVFEGPPNLTEALAELERLKNHPNEWRDQP